MARPPTNGDDRVDWEALQNVKDRVEYMHSEHKKLSAETSQNMRVLENRINRHDYLLEKTEERFALGAETMSSIKDGAEAVAKQLNTPWYKVAAFIAPTVIAFIVAIMSIVWQAARTPTGEEMEQLREKVRQVQTSNDMLGAKLDLLLKRP